MTRILSLAEAQTLPPGQLRDWASIKGWNGVYEVHPNGIVRRTHPNRVGPKPKAKLNTTIAGAGYHQVRLSLLPRRERRYIHQLVLEAFGPPKCYACEVDHKDCDKSNNNILNLQWLTHQQNAARRGLCHG